MSIAIKPILISKNDRTYNRKKQHFAGDDIFLFRACLFMLNQYLYPDTKINGYKSDRPQYCFVISLR